MRRNDPKITEALKNPIMDKSPEAEKLRAEVINLVGEYFRLAHAPEQFVPGKDPIPVSGRVYDQLDMQMLVSSSLDFWLTSGRFNELFEAEFSKFLGIEHVVTTNSGSSANLLAISDH